MPQSNQELVGKSQGREKGEVHSPEGRARRGRAHGNVVVKEHLIAILKVVQG